MFYGGIMKRKVLVKVEHPEDEIGSIFIVCDVEKHYNKIEAEETVKDIVKKQLKFSVTDITGRR